MPPCHDSTTRSSFSFISRDHDAPQFLRLSFLADNVYPFTVFPNKMPRALPCLQTLSHQANFPLILFLSHSQLFRGFRKMFAELKKGLSPLFSHYPFSVSLFLARSHVLSYSCLNGRARERLTGSSQPKAALRARSAVKDNSNRGRTKEEGRGRGGGRETYGEKQSYCGAGVFEIIHIVK